MRRAWRRVRASRTHLPVELESEEGIVLDEQLARQVRDESTCPPGNRVWVVAGASGAGKSELLAWLDLTLAQQAPTRHRSLLHLHQHEADPLQIAGRLHSLLPVGREGPQVRLRWHEVERKPRAVAKILLLLALDQLTSSDEEAYPLYYGLSELVEVHLRRFIEGEGSGLTTSAFPLIGQQEWEAFRAETALPVPFSSAAFQQALQAAFHHYLFSDLSLSTVMRSVSEALREQRTRPVLLVDDLIGSLHLFAPDLLTNLLSTPGTWDVVCGVSPRSESERVAAFLDRLAAASGVQGVYHIAQVDETQCLNLARAYLLEYRRLRTIEGEAFFPFNQQALLRLWRGFPDHRRTPGAFLHHLKLVVAQEGEGALLAQLARLAAPGYAVRTTDPHLARLAELYGPPLTSPQASSIHLAPHPFFRQPEHEVVLPSAGEAVPCGLSCASGSA